MTPVLAWAASEVKHSNDGDADGVADGDEDSDGNDGSEDAGDGNDGIDNGGDERGNSVVVTAVGEKFAVSWRLYLLYLSRCDKEDNDHSVYGM